MPRYDQYQTRDVSNEHEHRNHYDEHRDNGNAAASYRRAAQGGHDVQAIAYRRVNRAYCKADHHHYAEMYEVDPEGLHHGNEDGPQDDQRGGHFEYAAGQEHRHIDQQQDQPWFVSNAEQMLCDGLRNPLVSEQK